MNSDIKYSQKNNNLKNKKSILGYKWSKREFDNRLSNLILQNYDISPIVADLLSIRDINLSEISLFLNPKIKTCLPDPFTLDGVSESVSYIIKAIKESKKITIFADYDVDGATSAAILKRFLQNIDYQADIYIPDRIKEGYGPNSKALIDLKNKGTDLVITLDCGTVSFEPLLKAKEVGLDIIVIDHHLGVLEKPKAIAIINPNQIGDQFLYKNLCAAGITFLFVVALNKRFREEGFYKKFQEPNLLDLLDLVALGTVCDVMELVGLNRVFVAQGLKIIKQRQNLGIKTICDLAAIDQEPNSYHLGFIIGPRINAGGRIGKSDLGARLLSTNDEFEAMQIAEQLEQYNKDRKDIENIALKQAIESLEIEKSNFSNSDPVIFAVSDKWHQGVIGIIASRLKDIYNKPVAVITIDKKTRKGKASCRSISGVDFGAQIINAKMNNLIIEGGGHAMAGGFSIDEDKIKDLHHFFCEKMAKDVDIINSQKIMNYDIEIDMMQVNVDLVKDIDILEPFGVGNNRPKFYLKNVRKISAKIVGSERNHISCIFCGNDGIVNNKQIQVILFRGVGTDLESVLLAEKYNKKMNLIGTLSINSWMGVEKVQMILEDIDLEK